MTVRVTTLKGADADAYYVEQLPDYYLDSGEPRGVWFGHGAHTLGLTGEVDDDAFLAVMAGMRPDNPNKCRRDHCCTVPPAHEPHVGPATAYARGDPEPRHVTRQTVARFGRPPDQAKSANVVGAAPRDVARGVDGEPRCAVGGAKGGSLRSPRSQKVCVPSSSSVCCGAFRRRQPVEARGWTARSLRLSGFGYGSQVWLDMRIGKRHTVVVEAGVRELRDHLSRYLEVVREGREVTVTDHGHAVARLVPLEQPRRIDRLIKEGLITPALTPKRERPKQRIVAQGTVSDLVGDQRR